MITLYQVDGGLVPPVADARLYEMLSGSAVGIVQGCEITSLGGNQLQITSGWGVCLGRVFQIEQETINATVSTSGEVSGRLFIAIDVSNSEAPIVFQTQAQSPLPPLTQEDINGSGTIYQIELARYTINELQISDLQTTYATANVSGISEYACTTSGRVHALTGSGNNIKFVTDAAFAEGDTFTVNGTPVTAQTTAGDSLPAGCFVAGAVVYCYLSGATLYFDPGYSAQATANSAQAKANAAMPISGGIFTGNITANNTARAGAYIRNNEIKNSTGSSYLSSNLLIFMRK